MNLHGIVLGAIEAINPSVLATLKYSTGYTTNADGSQVPTYATVTGYIQVQAFSERTLDALKHEDNLNVESILRKVYVNGALNGVIRSRSGGGDILQFGGFTWLVVQVIEAWPDWSSVIVEQQVDT